MSQVRWADLSRGARAVVLLILAVFAPGNSAFGQDLTNAEYRLSLGKDSALVVSRGKLPPQTFTPAFAVLFREDDPHIALRPAGIKRISYNVATWQSNSKSAGKLGKVDTSVTAGDGFDPTILKGDQKNRTPDYFQAAPVEVIRASAARVGEGQIIWSFPESPLVELSAVVTLPKDKGQPQLVFSFKAKKAGWYSVGYVGAPAVALASASEIWQPLIWAENRFPDRSYLTAAFHCPVPAAMVTAGGATVGVVVDPKEFPFDPLPTFANSRFGVMLRNAAGQAQSMVFAPILGGVESQMKPSQRYSFSLRLMVGEGSCNDALREVARGLYGFHDQRVNTLCSLNQTLENMIDYGLSDFSRFNEDLRGCAYDTDAPGTVKNVSALHPLSVAMVTDNPDIYRFRARPIIEFLLSRQKFLFATNPEIKVQSPGWQLLGPCAPLSELAALYEISQRRTPLYLELAAGLVAQTRTLNLDDEEKGGTWQNYLALYRASGKSEYLKKATDLADAYLAARVGPPQPAFGGMFFWSSFVPDWQALLELYGETHEQRYLDAAHFGAKLLCQYIWFCPAVPEGDVVVNRGGVAPEYGYLKKRGAGPIHVPQESVAAWRVSEIGLTSESCGTSSGHRGILPACYAPGMLRLAELTNDDFLHDVARWAVVGRYANFPGYHINTGRTTVYEKPDYPLRPFKELTYNSFHFNHIWPHIALLVDYLVSDVYAKSAGQISFPSHYAEGYGYLKFNIYGDRPGKFYDEKNVWLWMPKGLLTLDNVQANYIAARGNGSLYVALANQSPAAQAVNIQINPKLVEFAPGATVDVWRDNRRAESVKLVDGKLSIAVGPAGISAVAIRGVKLSTRFQGDVASPSVPLSDKSHVVLPYAGVHAMLLSMGPKYTHAYVYSQATYKELKSVTLHYRTGDQWRSVTDSKYPYEFTVELQPSDSKFDFWVEGVGVDGATNRSEQATLTR